MGTPVERRARLIIRAAPGADRPGDRARAPARERIRHGGAGDRRRRAGGPMRRRDDQDRQCRACRDLRHPVRRSPQRRRKRRASCRLWRADAGRAHSRRDRYLARPQEGAAGGRSGRGQRAARRTHVAQPEPAGGDPNRNLERLRRVGRARGRLCPDRGRRRLVSRESGRDLRRQDLAHAGRLRRGRRDRGGVRRAADRRLLRLRAHHRRLFARQRDPGLRRHARRIAHHPGGHRRALRHHRARRRPADVPALRRIDRARPGRGGGRGRRDAGGGADRKGVPGGDPVAPRSTRRRRG